MEQDAAHIVVENEGSDHHFQKGKNVNVGNHERYMLESDVERQLTLESYGYRFLRINRFNLGKDPVQTLSDRLANLVARLTEDSGIPSVEQMQRVADGLTNKEYKPCARCAEIKPLAEFFDRSLKGGHGRICMRCKTAAAAKRTVAAPSRRRRWRGWT